MGLRRGRSARAPSPVGELPPYKRTRRAELASNTVSANLSEEPTPEPEYSSDPDNSKHSSDPKDSKHDLKSVEYNGTERPINAEGGEDAHYQRVYDAQNGFVPNGEIGFSNGNIAQESHRGTNNQSYYKPHQHCNGTQGTVLALNFSTSIF